MNIAVISPDNRGMGVTSLAILLGIDLRNRGNSVVVTSLASGETDLKQFVGTIPPDLGDIENGMGDLIRVKNTGTLSPSDIKSYCIDVGVDIMMRSDRLNHKEVQEAIDFISEANIDGRGVICVVDVDIHDMNNIAVQNEIKKANVIIVVLDQSIAHLEKFKKNRANYSKNFRTDDREGNPSKPIPVIVAVNRYEKFAGTFKDIWSAAGIKNGDNWFEVRYNKCVPLMTAKCFIQQLADAMQKAGDADVATLKSDIARIGMATEKHRK